MLENSIVVSKTNLPDTVGDLSKFVLIGREKLVAVRAEIRAIDKVGLAEEVRRQKLEEAQAISEAVLDAEVKIGELMQSVPKVSYNRGNQYTGGKSTPLSNSQKSKAAIIKDSGFTQKQVERFQTLAANPDLVEQAKAEARENDDIVSRSLVLNLVKERKRADKEAFRETQRCENAKKIKALSTPLDAQGLFQTIVVDPPWDWSDEGDINQFGRTKPEYATMPIDEIAKLPIDKISDDNCHLYLWVRGSTEQVLFAVKGSQLLKRKDACTHFCADRGKGHSAKPDEFYKLVESCSYAPFIDVFGRKERDGWSVWGENG